METAVSLFQRQFGVDFDNREIGLVDLDGTADPFSAEMRNGIWKFGIR